MATREQYLGSVVALRLLGRTLAWVKREEYPLFMLVDVVGRRHGVVSALPLVSSRLASYQKYDA